MSRTNEDVFVMEMNGLDLYKTGLSEMSKAKKSAVGTSSYKELEGLERAEALKKGYDENGGAYIRLGGQYVVSRSEIWRPVLFYADTALAMFELVTASYFSVLQGDMEAASECFHFIQMIFNMMVISANLQYYRKNIDELFTAIGAGFFDYGDTIDPQTKEKMDKHMMDMRANKKVMLIGHLPS
ncbi:hypothetical protein GE061_008473 [Apolygus lucorum]|uniref:Uncharacterized protein n=1 Tax=Apolygus lucorum TaxID=248454 RepID=A0A8S9WRE7_APOLU|nr:hypothetical protein GE061_008473 [Apolygus lucorum]